ncbi:hypothetical protein Mrose_02924 [Calidithermus roseus]|uniref:Uncharacterized protein n=1 Tax=Calidithermus roseus TaxID=1644118 RepID=A0A399EIB9_9DEIN|nr:hypothetical protein Mrose_02924 [Calidithermus roseus]
MVLGAGKYGLENLAAVPPSGAMVVGSGPKHKNASGKRPGCSPYGNLGAQPPSSSNCTSRIFSSIASG